MKLNKEFRDMGFPPWILDKPHRLFEKEKLEKLINSIDITDYAYQKAREYARLSCEVYGGSIEAIGHLVVPKGSKNRLITDVLFPNDQICNTNQCWLDPGNYDTYAFSRKKSNYNPDLLDKYDCIGLWHSHGTLHDVFYSRDDLGLHSQFLSHNRNNINYMEFGRVDRNFFSSRHYSEKEFVFDREKEILKMRLYPNLDSNDIIEIRFNKNFYDNIDIEKLSTRNFIDNILIEKSRGFNFFHSIVVNASRDSTPYGETLFSPHYNLGHLNEESNFRKPGIDINIIETGKQLTYDERREMLEEARNSITYMGDRTEYNHLKIGEIEKTRSNKKSDHDIINSAPEDYYDIRKAIEKSEKLSRDRKERVHSKVRIIPESEYHKKLGEKEQIKIYPEQEKTYEKIQNRINCSEEKPEEKIKQKEIPEKSSPNKKADRENIEDKVIEAEIISSGPSPEKKENRSQKEYIPPEFIKEKPRGKYLGYEPVKNKKSGRKEKTIEDVIHSEKKKHQSRRSKKRPLNYKQKMPRISYAPLRQKFSNLGGYFRSAGNYIKENARRKWKTGIAIGLAFALGAGITAYCLNSRREDPAQFQQTPALEYLASHHHRVLERQDQISERLQGMLDDYRIISDRGIETSEQYSEIVRGFNEMLDNYNEIRQQPAEALEQNDLGNDAHEYIEASIRDYGNLWSLMRSHTQRPDLWEVTYAANEEPAETESDQARQQKIRDFAEKYDIESLKSIGTSGQLKPYHFTDQYRISENREIFLSSSLESDLSKFTPEIQNEFNHLFYNKAIV